MDVFQLCAAVFASLNGGARVRNDGCVPGSSEIALFRGAKFMTYTQEESFPHYIDTEGCTPITLISIHLPAGADGARARTLVVADRAYGNSGQVGGGDIREVMAELLNRELVSDGDVRACLAHHGAIS